MLLFEGGYCGCWFGVVFDLVICVVVCLFSGCWLVVGFSLAV